MKRIINILICTAVTVFAISCNRYEIEIPVEYNDRIEINLSSAATKAEDTSTESFLNHVDIIIFNHNGTAPTTVKHYERIDVKGASSSLLTAKRRSFTPNEGYYVQVIANSTAPVETFGAIEDYDDMINMKQADRNVHITGLNIDAAPDHFLMDGVAYIGDTKPAAPGTAVINNGVLKDNTVLNVHLARAAAKIEVIVTAGGGANDDFDIIFKNDLVGSHGASYKVSNLPYSTFVVDYDPTTLADDELTSTDPTRNDYFKWNPETSPKSASITAYAYAHDWKDQSNFQKEPCLVVNLPFVFTDNTKDPAVVTNYPNNWYKIPMSADEKFDRNMYYKVNVTVNRPGATSMSDPVNLGPVNYTVGEWVPVSVNLKDAVLPKYLTVNRNSMEMYNIANDSATLEFSSSSAVTVGVSNVYYIDKFGATVNVNNHGITATADGLNGNVVINSPLPTNNTILYFTLTLTNADGQSEQVTVKQYPLVYVVNTLSWYSYRDDFKGDGVADPTTIENLSSTNNIVGISYSNGEYSYNSSSSGFFRSKVVRSTYSSTHNYQSYRGRSDIDGYYWNYYTKGYEDIQDPGNARMYHITIMASSGDYVIGRPKMTTTGITDPGEDNAKLVSPSFMIASRLAVITVGNIDLIADTQEKKNDEYLAIYADHCEKYVEVYKDPVTGDAVHLNDWRLPTAAELGIIYDLQGTENQSADAIDYLLNSGHYFSASGPIENPNSDMSGSSVRCVRDVF